MTTNYTTKKIEKSEQETVYAVLVDGQEVGRITSWMHTERVCFSGQRIGSDRKPRRVYTVQGCSYPHPTLKQAAEDVMWAYNLKAGRSK